MIKIKSVLVLISLCIALVYSNAMDLDKRFQLLPLPQHIEIEKGAGISYKDLAYITSTDKKQIPALGMMLNGLPQVEKTGKTGILLAISDEGIPEQPEGYVLEVSNKGVTIMSRSDAGLFYGCQTLEQLLEDSRQFDLKIPFLKITDYPGIAYRAIHLDTKHHLDRTEYYYRLMDKLACYKIMAHTCY